MTDAPTTDTSDVRGRLAQRAETTEVARAEPQQLTIAQLIDRQRSEIARALPKHMDADRLARIATTVVKTTPKLLECSASSLLGALMLSAQTGLEPGPLGHAYFVPRWNKNSGQTECQWMLGYKGIIELARRSGQLTSIEAREVCERDHFEYSYGLDERLEHWPYMGGERGPIVAVWGLAKFVDGGHYFVVMSKADIDAAKDRSDSAKRGFGPWISDYAAMARKTVIRRMVPYLPLSAEQAAVVAQDETVHTSISRDMADQPPEAGWMLDPTPAPAAPAIDATAAEAHEAPEGVTADGEVVDGDSQVGDAEVDTRQPTQAQMRKLHAALRDAGIDDDHRHWAASVLDTDVDSLADLNRTQVSTLIDHLEQKADDQ